MSRFLSALFLLALATLPARADWCTLSFAEEVQVGVGANPGQSVVADFNHDGRNDLAVVNRVQAGTIAIRLGQVNGTFASPSYVSLGAVARGALFALKLDGDAHLDLVAVAGDSVRVLLGNGLGGFTLGDLEFVGITPGDMAAADFDNDGDTDFAVTRTSSYPQGVQIYVNAGGGNLTHKTLVEMPDASIRGITAGDFDGDGNADLAFAEQGHAHVRVVFGAGNGFFFSPAVYIVTTTAEDITPDRVASGDFNRDGYDDLAIGHRDPYGNGGMTMAVVLSNGAGRTFAGGVEYGDFDANGVYDILTHDIDGDGKLDILVGGLYTHIFRGRGDGTFYFFFDLGELYFRGSMAIVDVDGDGGPDVLAAMNGSSFVTISQNFCGAATLTVASSANPASHGSSFTITATLTSNPAATGTMELSQTGGGTLGSANVSGTTSISVTLSRPIGTYEFALTYSGDDRFFTSTKTFTQTVQAAPFGPPPGFAATSSGGAPHLSWLETTGTYQYEVFRNTGSGFVSIGTTPATQYDDATAPAGAAILYKVRAVSPSLVNSAFSAQDVTTTHVYTDPVLTAGVSIVKRAHLTELRNAADAVRLLAGLSAATWTDSVPTVIKAVHISELDAAINQARTALGLATITFDGSTIIKALHMTQARDALR